MTTVASERYYITKKTQNSGCVQPRQGTEISNSRARIYFHFFLQVFCLVHLVRTNVKKIAQSPGIQRRKHAAMSLAVMVFRSREIFIGRHAKGRFRKRVVLANVCTLVPAFVPGEHACERTLIPVFVPGEHPNGPSCRFLFWGCDPDCPVQTPNQASGPKREKNVRKMDFGPTGKNGQKIGNGHF